MNKARGHEHYMRLALRLARRGEGKVSPNPMVGSVIVKGNVIVGEGYHHRAGAAHAEVEALQKAGHKTRGADMYVTLEPCCTKGRTGPCTEAIIASGIKRVFVGVKDPSPEVNGRGIRKLRARGITVKSGILENECRRLNEIFFKYIATGQPFVILKAALTLDGNIATESGESQWITHFPARRFAHGLRSRVDGILVGRGTVVKDVPRLTVRLSPQRGKPPVRIVLDSRLRIPLNAPLFSSLKEAPTWVMTTSGASLKKVRILESRGIKVIRARERNGQVSMKDCLKRLGMEGLTSILVEGGASVNTSLLEERLVDKIYFCYGPLILGGKRSKRVVGREKVERLSSAFTVKDIRARKLGEDILVEGYL